MVYWYSNHSTIAHSGGGVSFMKTLRALQSCLMGVREDCHSLTHTTLNEGVFKTCGGSWIKGVERSCWEKKYQGNEEVKEIKTSWKNLSHFWRNNVKNNDLDNVKNNIVKCRIQPTPMYVIPPRDRFLTPIQVFDISIHRVGHVDYAIRAWVKCRIYPPSICFTPPRDRFLTPIQVFDIIIHRVGHVHYAMRVRVQCRIQPPSICFIPPRDRFLTLIQVFDIIIHRVGYVDYPIMGMSKMSHLPNTNARHTPKRPLPYANSSIWH